MDESLQAILDFVEGRMSAKDFEQRVYNDPGIERVLKDESLRWHDTYMKTDPYTYVIALDYNHPADLLNAQGAMELFLTRKGISFARTSAYSDFHDALLSSQPRWLDLSRSSYFKEQILPEVAGRTGSDLRAWLRNRLLELFRYHNKPPKWIQNPQWLINENGPMYFLGQIKVDDPEIFHDEAAVYVFLDRKTGETRTITQVY
jgi:hypothetical protein